MYCGRRLVIKGECTSGRGRCPSCGHIIYVPNQERIKEVLGKDTIDWSKVSDEQVEKMMKFETRSKIGHGYTKTGQAIWNLMDFGNLLPNFDEITLFTLSFSLLFLLAISTNLRQEIWTAIVTLKDLREPTIFILVLMMAAGMILSFLNVFFRTQKYNFEKYLMLLFAVFVTAGTGIYSGWLVLKEAKDWMMIFPIWNIVNGGILLYLLRDGVLDTDCIVENEFNHWQVLASVFCVGTILAACNYYFKMHWAISYSICACYTLTINDTVQHLLGINKRNMENSEIAAKETEEEIEKTELGGQNAEEEKN